MVASLLFAPPVADDLALRQKIERWLTDQGYRFTYGDNSARALRGDAYIGARDITTAKAFEPVARIG